MFVFVAICVFIFLTLSSYGLMSNQGQLLVGVLPLCKDEVGVFYNLPKPTRLHCLWVHSYFISSIQYVLFVLLGKMSKVFTHKSF